MWKIICDYNNIIKTYFLSPDIEVIIGRSRDANIVIPDPKISRKHLKIILENNKPKFIDLNSTNGSYLNNKRKDEAFVSEKDVIKIGNSLIRIIPYHKEQLAESQDSTSEYYSGILSQFKEIKKELETLKNNPTADNFLNFSNKLIYLELLVANLNREYSVLLEINKISEVINIIHDPTELIVNIIDFIINITNANRAIFFINNIYDKQNKLKLAPTVFVNLESGIILTEKTLKEQNLSLPSDKIEKLLIDHNNQMSRIIFENDFPNSNKYNFLKETPFFKKTKCFFILPIIAQHKKIGVLYLDSTDYDKKNHWTQFEIEFLKKLSPQLAVALDNSLIYTDIKELYLSTIEVLSSALDAKDTYTEGHSRRVTDYSVALAEEIGLNDQEIEKIKIAAILHDIGKIGIRDNILCKPGRLTDEEYKIIKTHPSIGEKIIKPIRFLSDKAPLIKYHHERWDGKGYPDGLKEEEIPLGARIISIADAFDAMTSKRAYRNNLPLEVALEEIKRCSGTQFDPNLTGPFIKVFKKKFLPIWKEYSQKFKEQEKIYE